MKTEKKKIVIPISYSSFLILQSLKRKSHGYKIMKYVSEVTNGIITIGPATMYRTLSDFLNQGYISYVAGDNDRKEYILTASGEKLLEEQQDFIEILYKINK